MVPNIVVKKPDFTAIPYVYGSEDCEPNFGIGFAKRDFYLIFYVFSGCGSYTSPRGEYTVSSGEIYIIRPGEITKYKADAKNPWSYSWIRFKLKDGVTHSDIPFLEFLNNDVIRSEKCRPIFERIKSISHSISSDYIVMNSILYDLLWTLSSQSSESTGSKINLKDYIDIALQYIHTNYIYNISVEEISNFLGINRRYFCSIFYSKKGITPKEYIIQYRLQKACELLMDGYDVTSAASLCGYQNVYAFSKIFKKKKGVSPSQYKTSHNV